MFSPYLKSTWIVVKPSSIVVSILSTFANSCILFSIGFTTSSSMSLGLVPGYTTTMGKDGGLISGSSDLGIVNNVTTPTTAIIRNIIKVNW
jgi:hypothetical protein